ncbi:MAG: DUF4293 domain-containing protein [Bacteroidales bacterium]|jgi:hypothetical protein
MIQRIQTLYLLGAVIVGVVMFFIPLGHLILEENLVVDFFHNGIANDELLENSYKTLPLTTLLGISTGLSLLIIFLYKRRILQMRLCGINIFLNIGLIGLIVFYMFDAAKKLNAEKDFNVAIILPVVSIIFLYLAIRNIGKDEARVKAADRIR